MIVDIIVNVLLILFHVQLTWDSFKSIYLFVCFFFNKKCLGFRCCTCCTLSGGPPNTSFKFFNNCHTLQYLLCFLLLCYTCYHVVKFNSYERQIILGICTQLTQEQVTLIYCVSVTYQFWFTSWFHMSYFVKIIRLTW